MRVVPVDCGEWVIKAECAGNAALQGLARDEGFGATRRSGATAPGTPKRCSILPNASGNRPWRHFGVRTRRICAVRFIRTCRSDRGSHSARALPNPGKRSFDFKIKRIKRRRRQPEAASHVLNLGQFYRVCEAIPNPITSKQNGRLCCKIKRPSDLTRWRLPFHASWRVSLRCRPGAQSVSQGPTPIGRASAGDDSQRSVELNAPYHRSGRGVHDEATN
jgi:hypothetical protein